MTVFLWVLTVLYVVGVAYVIFGCMVTMLVPFALLVMSHLQSEEKE